LTVNKTSLSFNQLSGFPELFCRYIENHQSVSQFYAGDPYSEKEWKNQAEKVIQRSYPRTEMLEILRRQNENYGGDSDGFSSIDLLGDSSTIAVVTGQQAGIFSGPIYTFYKAVAAIKMSEILERKTGFKAIPVFWIESLDHDLQEVSKIGVVSREGKHQKLTYNQKSNHSREPVGSIQLGETIHDFLDSIFTVLPKTEFSGELLDMLRGCYRSNETFSSAFAKLLVRLFPNSGLVVFDPFEKTVYPLMQPLLYRIIRQNEDLLNALTENNERIKQLVEKLQVTFRPNTLPLFYHRNGKRTVITKSEDKYFIGKQKKGISLEDLLEYSSGKDHIFSPNVLTRPLLQDFLFPTCLYVAGPAEIAYFSQVHPLYRVLEIPMPIIYPRPSLTIIDKKVQKVLLRNNLSPHLFFSRDNNTYQIFQLIGGKDDFSPLFNESRDDILSGLEKIRKLASEIDLTLSGAVETAGKKILYQVEKIYQKCEKAEMRQHETRVQQINFSRNILYPNKQMQERFFSLISFLNRYGIDFISELTKNINFSSRYHQLYYI